MTNPDGAIKTRLLGVIMFLFFICIVTMFIAYVCFFNVIYQDYDGNPVVCDVDGHYYAVTHPTCKKALQGIWKRTNLTIWQGTCNKGICTYE